MKKIRNLMLALMASTLLLSSCGQVTTLANGEALYEESVVVKTTEEVFNDLVSAAESDTNIWYELNKQNLEYLYDTEIESYKYEHFRDTFYSFLEVLPEETQTAVSAYINDNYFYEIAMYDNCLKLVRSLMDLKRRNALFAPIVVSMYEKIDYFMENATLEEQKGYYLFMQMNATAREVGNRSVMKINPRGPLMVIIPFIEGYTISMFYSWYIMSTEDQACLKAFTSKYMVSLYTAFSSLYSAILLYI